MILLKSRSSKTIKRGYRYEAIPKDYTNVPPSNLSIVKMNGDLLDEVLNETSEYHVIIYHPFLDFFFFLLIPIIQEQLKDLIEQLKEKIYPKIRSLVNDFIAVLLREVFIDLNFLYNEFWQNKFNIVKQAKIPVTLENIKSFKLDSWREHVSTLESSSDIVILLSLLCFLKETNSVDVCS